MPDCPWCGEPLTTADDDCDGRCINGHEWWDDGAGEVPDA